MGRMGLLLGVVGVLFVLAVGAALQPLLSPGEETPVADAGPFAEGQAPLTVEEIGELSVTEVMTASPNEAREVIAAADEVKTTFESCEKDGVPGLKVRTTCVTAKTRPLVIGAGDIGIFDSIGTFEDLSSVEIRGGQLADLSALAAYPGLGQLVLIDVKIGDASALRQLTGLRRLAVDGDPRH